MAMLVIGRALLTVGQDLIGFVDFLELGLGLLVAGILVGMVLNGLFAEGALEVGVGTGPADAEDFIKAALGGHRRC